MKVKIIKQTVSDTDKNGNKLISKKSGKPFYKVGIQTNEHGAQWINGLLNFSPNWEGTEQELEIYDEEFNGKTYKKFKLEPKKPAGLSEAQLFQIKQASEQAYAANQNIMLLTKRLEEAGVIPDPKKMSSVGIPYPERDASNTPDFDKQFDPDDLPAF